MEIILRVILSCFLLTNSLLSEEKIKYFADYSSSSNKEFKFNNIFRIELDKNLNSINKFKDIPWMNTIKLKQISGYYKVLYQNSKLINVEEVKTTGYYYLYGKINNTDNANKINLGIISKFDNDNRIIYSYNPKTSEVCNIFYGIQYIEKTCILNEEQKTKKRYYKNNKLEIEISYKHRKIIGYKKTKLNFAYDNNGKAINLYLNKLVEVDTSSSYKDKQHRENFQSLIKEQKKRLKNIPDLNMTLEKQYIDKIDKLNGR